MVEQSVSSMNYELSFAIDGVVFFFWKLRRIWLYFHIFDIVNKWFNMSKCNATFIWTHAHIDQWFDQKKKILSYFCSIHWLPFFFDLINRMHCFCDPLPTNYQYTASKYKSIWNTCESPFSFKNWFSTQAKAHTWKMVPLIFRSGKNSINGNHSSVLAKENSIN